MTFLDIIVLIVVGVAAIGGFQRGLIQELLSLAAWGVMVVAVRTMHTPLTETLAGYTGPGVTTALLSFALLLLIPYAGMKLVASKAGAASRGSFMGPVDRVLGLGFGMVKGLVIMIVAFSLVVLGYDMVWSERGRPDWITQAQTYTLLDAGSRSLVEMIAQGRERLSSDAG